jgi:hypothetical protein
VSCKKGSGLFLSGRSLLGQQRGQVHLSADGADRAAKKGSGSFLRLRLVLIAEGFV